ncbi:MAG: HAD family hydrolase [Chroococcidiopsidaceae cyanobacterium CP_BM_ER_R8_30]|nr:HAD family hydrolase [Chroococcidiopsidaceae cyanobacterium CP_BM_ER_R8_30]
MLLTETEVSCEYQLEEVDYQVVHAVAGRFRIRVARITSDPEYARKLNWLIESLSFVSSVRISPTASSVIVQYEVNAVSTATAQKELFTCIQRASFVEILEPRALETGPLDRPRVNDWQDLGLPFISLGLALLAAPLELPFLIVGAAIAGAAMPWFMRATDSIVTNRQLNVDCLDSLWMALHTLNGQYVAPSLKTSLVELRRTCRGMTTQDRERQFLELLDSLDQGVGVERDGLHRHLPVKELQEGDRVIVYAGDLIPVDGRVLHGTALIDAYHLTGESQSVTCLEGQEVYASTLVLEGQLYILTKRAGRNTRVGLANQLLQTAPVHDTQIGAYQAEFAKSAVMPTMLLSAVIFALTGAYSPAIAPFQLDFGSGVQIAMPTAILTALTLLARNGVYVRSGRVLEALARVDIIVFGITSTLTHSVRLEINSAIATLVGQGIEVYLLTHDDWQIANAITCKSEINPSHSHAETCHERIVELVRELRNRGKTVAFVGDSIDAANVIHADISVAFATGSDMAQETADVVILDDNICGLPHAINVAKQAMEVVYQNTAIIVIPNLIVVAGGVFFGLNPIVNVITNNFSAFIAEFLNSSRPFFDIGILTQSKAVHKYLTETNLELNSVETRVRFV